MINEDIEKLKGVLRSNEKVLRLSQAAFGNITANEMALLQVICNMAIDVAGGDKEAAREYLFLIVEREPVLAPLFAAVGLKNIKQEMEKENDE